MLDRTRLIPILLALTVAAVFWPAAEGRFLKTWDDGTHIAENPEIRSLSPENVAGIFTSFRSNLYKPLATLSHAIEFHFFGLDPRAVRMVNILLHAANTAMVFLFLRRLGVSSLAAAVCASLFGLHPMRVESVAWAAQRKDLLFAFFYLAGLSAYVGPHRKRALPLFILSCLSKAVALTFPAALLLIDRYRNGALTRKDLVSKIPYMIISLITLLLAVAAGAVKESAVGHLWQNIPMAGAAICYYLSRLLMPLNLAAFHPEPSGWTTGLILCSVLGATALAAFFYLARRHRDILLGAGFFLVTILPNIQLIPSVGQSLVVDHYAYLPSIGFFFMISRFGERFFAGSRRAAGIALILLVGLAMSLASRAAIPHWRDDIAIWTRVLEVHPGTETAYFNRADAFLAANDAASALSDFDRALDLAPKDADAWINRAQALRHLDRPKEARESLERALEIRPRNAIALNGLGELELAEGQIDRARSYFEQAATVDPRLWQAHANLGQLDLAERRSLRAIVHYERALAQHPPSRELFSQAGIAYGAAGRLPDAAAMFREALKLDPSSSKDRKFLETTLLLQQDAEERLAEDVGAGPQ